MKNIIKNITSNISNNRGSVPGNIIRGLSVGVFAMIVLYGVYVSYHNSPAYNPARRGIYTGEGQNLSANALEGFMLNFDNTNHLPDGIANGSNVIHTGSGFARTNSVRNQFSKEESDFESAREYMTSQKEAQARARQTAQAEEESVSDEKDDVRNSYDRKDVVRSTGAIVIKDESKSNKSTKTTAQKPQTQTNKLASAGSSSGGASGGSSKGGGSASRGAGSSNSGSDNLYSKSSDSGTKALPQNNVTKAQAGSNAFQFGRGGAMGGINVARGSGGVGDNGGKRGGSAKAELSSADMYSRRAVKSLQSAGAKDLAQAKQEAENAFDGGGIISGATINGDHVVDPGSSNLDLNPGGEVLRGLDETKGDVWDLAAERRRLTQYAVYHLIYAAIAALSAAIAICALQKEANVWTEAAAAGIALLAVYTIWFQDFDGDGMKITETLSRLETLGSSAKWWAYPTLGLLTGVVGAAFVWGDSIAEWAEAHMAGLWNFLVPTATVKQVSNALQGVGQFAINEIDDKN